MGKDKVGTQRESRIEEHPHGSILFIDDSIAAAVSTKMPAAVISIDGLVRGDHEQAALIIEFTEGKDWRLVSRQQISEFIDKCLD
jgi:hypothetical protein